MDMLDLEDVFPGTADAPLPDYYLTVERSDGSRDVLTPGTFVPAGEGQVRAWSR